MTQPSIKEWKSEENRGEDYVVLAAAAAKSLQSCPTLCDPIDSSPPGSSIHGIFQARTLEWVAISFSIAGKWRVKVKLLSRVRLLETTWTTAYQAPLSVGFSRQEYWSGVPLPSLIWGNINHKILLVLVRQQLLSILKLKEHENKDFLRRALFYSYFVHDWPSWILS